MVHGLLDKIMLLLEVPWTMDHAIGGYHLEAVDGIRLMIFVVISHIVSFF